MYVTLRILNENYHLCFQYVSQKCKCTLVQLLPDGCMLVRMKMLLSFPCSTFASTVILTVFARNRNRKQKVIFSSLRISVALFVVCDVERNPKHIAVRLTVGCQVKNSINSSASSMHNKAIFINMYSFQRIDIRKLERECSPVIDKNQQISQI